MRAPDWFFLAGIVFVVFMFIGWIMNIVTVFGSSFDTITGELVLRVIGIVVPFIGGIVGWF